MQLLEVYRPLQWKIVTWKARCLRRALKCHKSRSMRPAALLIENLAPAIPLDSNRTQGRHENEIFL